MKVFDLVCDPSHSWLKVPVKELERLGIENKISPYSYINGKMSYLEEDCDMTTFMDARKARGEETRIKEYHNKERRSRIRGYESYPHVAVVATTQEPEVAEEVAEEPVVEVTVEVTAPIVAQEPELCV